MSKICIYSLNEHFLLISIALTLYNLYFSQPGYNDSRYLSLYDQKLF